MQKFLEITALDLLEVLVDIELLFDFVQILTGNLPLVQGLNRALPRVGPRRTHVSATFLSKLTISIADRAASAPLFPALVPARSIACSIVSTVNTPRLTGIS